MANGTSDELWKGLLAIFVAGAVFSWAVYGLVLGLIYVVHHIAWK